MGEPQWSMTCACGTPNCRGTIQCFHHLPLELQASYVAEGIVQQFLIEEFAGFPPGKRFP